MKPRFALGSLLVSLMDAEPGQERSFHRWYEQDHFYAGCMTGPGFFAGRRFVATRTLRGLRRPHDAAVPFLENLEDGAFLALYFIAEGVHAEAEAWAVERVNALLAADRMHPGRRSVHAGFYGLCFRLERDTDGVPAELALDHPFAGLLLASFEAEPGVGAERLEASLGELFAAWLPGSAVALAIGFAPIPLPDDAPAYVPRPDGLEGRRLVACFVEADPATAVGGLAEAAASLDGTARLSWLSPFVPTVPGTDRWIDELA